MIPSWKLDMGFLSFHLFLKELLKMSDLGASFLVQKMGFFGPREDNAEEKGGIFLLDLPDLPLECILERLPPEGLSSMAGVCRSFREMCGSDHLWEKHLTEKWGRLMGDSAYREWKDHIASRKGQTFLDCSEQKGYFGILARAFWSRRNEEMSCLDVDSVMALYLSLEGGKFSFPAQVYNRENGHVGFMLSCYDAKVSYDSKTDTFRASYSAQGRPLDEDSIEWNRLRAPTVDISPYDLHVSDCLNDLRPGDHIEVQWRKSKEFPYGWWYGVVGHLESCGGSDLHCQCSQSDTVILEFKQYTAGSKWREVSINRKEHHEVGDEADGFYAGVRKLYDENEISTWKRLWP